MLKIIALILISFIPFFSFCGKHDSQAQNAVKPKMKLLSNSFKEGEIIPKKHTCESDNVSPQLKWSDFPANTTSFVLVCDDPDAPMGTWVHWIVFNIPAGVNELTENQPNTKEFDNGMKQGFNSSWKFGYMGPCPPSGNHRYFFKIYALDVMLKAQPNIDKSLLLQLIEGHIIAEGQLMGKYKKEDK